MGGVVRLVVLPVDEVDSEGDRIRCRPYSAVVSAGACVARQRAHGEAFGGGASTGRGRRYFGACVRCAEGRVVAGRLGVEVPERIVRPLPPEPPEPPRRPSLVRPPPPPPPEDFEGDDEDEAVEPGPERDAQMAQLEEVLRKNRERRRLGLPTVPVFGDSPRQRVYHCSACGARGHSAKTCQRSAAKASRKAGRAIPSPRASETRRRVLGPSAAAQSAMPPRSSRRPVPPAEVRARCWACGAIGHRAADCRFEAWGAWMRARPRSAGACGIMAAC